jgi:hypothetical protein
MGNCAGIGWASEKHDVLSPMTLGRTARGSVAKPHRVIQDLLTPGGTGRDQASGQVTGRQAPEKVEERWSNPRSREYGTRLALQRERCLHFLRSRGSRVRA